MKKLLLLLVFSSTLLVACNKESTPHEGSGNSSDSSYVDAKKRISPEQAVTIFNSKFPNTTITEINLENMLHKSQYSIEGKSSTQEHKLVIDSHTKKIIRSESEPLDFDESNSTIQDKIDLKKTISMDKALNIAKKNISNKNIEEVTLEQDNKKIVWVISSQDDTEVTIDAYSGKIIHIDNDD